MSPYPPVALPRTALLALALVVLASAFAAVPAQPAAAGQCRNADAGPREITLKQARSSIVCLINRARSARGEDRLRAKSSLRKAAARHSRRMERRNCFSHRCPGERDLVARIHKTSYLPCGCSWGVGENIAWGGDKLGTPRRIFDAWMNSPSHRTNILKGGYAHVGVGVTWGSPGTGDNAATYTTDFGYKRG